MTLLYWKRRVFNVGDVTFFQCKPHVRHLLHSLLLPVPPPPIHFLWRLNLTLSEFTQGEKKGHCREQPWVGFIFFSLRKTIFVEVTGESCPLGAEGGRKQSDDPAKIHRSFTLQMAAASLMHREGGGGEQKETFFSTRSFKNDQTRCFCVADRCPNVCAYSI